MCTSHPNPLVLFGGAGFGGKSYLLRSAFPYFNGKYRKLGFPGQWGAFMCATYNDLVNRHLSKLEEELGHLGRVKESTKRGLCFEFHDPTMGGVYLRNIDDPDKYRGAEFPYILVDELTEVTRKQFDNLLYPLRSSLPLPFKPFLAATNPDGFGHQFVKKLWISKDFEGENLNPDRFFFVPALPTDNPTYDGNVYGETLSSLPEWKRRARLEGSWDAPSGARWPQLDSRTHLFNFQQRFPHGLPDTWQLIMGVDWGLKDPYCALWIAMDPENNAHVVREDYLADLSTDLQVERVLRKTQRNERVRIVYMDSQMWEVRRDPHDHLKTRGVAAADLYISALRADGRFGPVVKGYKGLRRVAFDTLDRLLNPNNGHPDLFIEEGCVNLWRELTGAVWDTRSNMYSREDIDPRSPDHAITALYYALHSYYLNPSGEPSQNRDQELIPFNPDKAFAEYQKRVDREVQLEIRNQTPQLTTRRATGFGYGRRPPR